MVKLNEWKWFSQHEEFPVFAELTKSVRFFIETKIIKKFINPVESVGSKYNLQNMNVQLVDNL